MMPEDKTPESLYFDKLNARRQAFVLNFIEERVATTAYQKAFSTKEKQCSYEVARTNAAKLLTNANVRAAIREKLNKIWAEKEEKIGGVFDELCALAFSDIKDVVSINDEGNISIKPLDEIDTRAVKKIKIRRERTSKATEAKPYDEISDIIEIEMYDKRGALSELAEIENMKKIHIEGDIVFKDPFQIIAKHMQKLNASKDES